MSDGGLSTNRAFANTLANIGGLGSASEIRGF